MNIIRLPLRGSARERSLIDSGFLCPLTSVVRFDLLNRFTQGARLCVRSTPPKAFGAAARMQDDSRTSNLGRVIAAAAPKAFGGLQHSRAPKMVHGDVGRSTALPVSTFQHFNVSTLRAFTLIEMILAIGIAAIVMVTISSVFFAALRLRNTTQDYVDAATPVDQTLTLMKRDLACVVTPTNGTTKVLSGDFRVGNVVSTGSGEPVAIEMFTATGQMGDKEPWGEIQRVTYELRDPLTHNAAGKELVRSVTRNLLSPTPSAPDDQPMMSGVQNITFTCYDGVQWWNTWDTTGVTSANTNLPVAVRVDIQPVGSQMAPIEMVVPIDSVTRSNVVLNANTNAP